MCEKNYWNSQEVRDEWKDLHEYYFPDDSKSKTECFVATTIGFEPELMQRFYYIRDNILSQSVVGKMFIRVYYNGLGNILAKIINIFDFLKPICKKILLWALKREEN